MRTMTETEMENRQTIKEILKKMGLPILPNFEADRLSGDGSDRDFYRVGSPKEEKHIFVFPSLSNQKSLLEANSCFKIGGHLKQNKVPVPKIYYFDGISGVIVYEDLGDTLLHHFVLENSPTKAQNDRLHLSPELIKLYKKAIDSLVLMQVAGARGFESSSCWETATYSKKLMLERESGYFLDAYCKNYRDIKDFPVGLEDEFITLADRVLNESDKYLMHRDYQSRNIMIKEGEIYIIDFQGARFGPLGYDLASLLNDPYVQLSPDIRLELLNYYSDTIKNYIYLDRDAFIKGYYHIALQRNLQILGAFSFLAKVREKPFFQPYIQPALGDLKVNLQGPLLNKYPILSEFVESLLSTKL